MTTSLLFIITNFNLKMIWFVDNIIGKFAIKVMYFIRLMKKFLVFFSLLLYVGSSTSFSVVYIAHDLHHLIQDTFHLHHHHHHDHEYRDKTHGHHHNALIDTMLAAIEEEPDKQPHSLIGIELFYHLNRAIQNSIENINCQYNFGVPFSSQLLTLCYLSPPTPPPRVANQVQRQISF